MIKLNLNPGVITLVINQIQVELGGPVKSLLVLAKDKEDRLINKNESPSLSLRQVSGHNLAYSIFDLDDIEGCILALEELISAYEGGNIIKPILFCIRAGNPYNKSQDYLDRFNKFSSLLKDILRYSREEGSKIHILVLDQSSSLDKFRYDFDYYLDILE